MAWSDRDSPKCNQLLTTVGLSVGLHVTIVFNQSNILTKYDEQVQYFIKIPNHLYSQSRGEQEYTNLNTKTIKYTSKRQNIQRIKSTTCSHQRRDNSDCLALVYLMQL